MLYSSSSTISKYFEWLWPLDKVIQLIPRVQLYENVKADALVWSKLDVLAHFIFISVFFWTFAKKLKLKKTKTQALKTQNSKLKNFLPKTQNSGNFFRNSRRFLPNYYNFYLKSVKIVQKLKNLPKTQGKISKNLQFPANPLSSKARKTSKKSLT